MKTLLLAICLLGSKFFFGQAFYSEKPSAFRLMDSYIMIDSRDDKFISFIADLFVKDIETVTGEDYQFDFKKQNVIIIGTLESMLIKDLARANKIKTNQIAGKWESFLVQTVTGPFGNYKFKNALVIAGSDARGTAYGVMELSRQLGISPWSWWADVPVKKKKDIYVKPNYFFSDAPKIKYRGIFINDEVPALSGWAKEKFGGFNHLFYRKVFELMLRLRANYIWPAMWGNAFYYDDSLNIKTADEYKIVIGTSHHEPLMRAHEEWKYFGKGQKWNYDSTEAGLKEFWKGGMQRAWNEKIVTIGMRGDGDEPMSRETATALLERIVKDQRKIIEDVTHKPADQTPQLWALYKEVQAYYDKGMRVPDDVTLLLCDDNWGNIRRLPKLTDKPRKGGYGIYYHFDYVGGPRNYKWINTNPLPRIWEQMHLAWEYKARQIWIVNVGDIKPMEFPISFFLDYAWNPEKIGADDVQKYSEQWAEQQFGNKYSKQIAEVLNTYSKYAGRRKPELIDQNSFSINHYGEFFRVQNDFTSLLGKAESINNLLTSEYKDAYFQLVLHPIRALCNLYSLYLNVKINIRDIEKNSTSANYSAQKVKELFEYDSVITSQYHKLKDGKWNHMMDQTHIGYTNWQQPPRQTMPVVKYVQTDSINKSGFTVQTLEDSEVNADPGPEKINSNSFIETNRYVSIEADHISRKINTNGITWTILPDLGRTGSAITPFPVTAKKQIPAGSSPHIEYEFYSYSQDSLKLQLYFSPTLNFQNSETGLQFAVSIDNEFPQIISLNREDNDVRTWSSWVANNIIIKTSKHFIDKPGKHILKYWMVDPGVVLQKLVIDFGGVQQSYLGPSETRLENLIIFRPRNK